MKRTVVLKFAASALVLGTVAVGCKPSSDRPASLSSSAPRADKQAMQVANRAADALRKGKVDVALKLAEEAVALSPRTGSHRATLGQVYLASGRFMSAETAFTDALTLEPGVGPTQLNLALTQIGLGKWDAARETLAAAKDRVAEADRGLALALAGDKEGGIAVLEAAAHADGAGVKARQNLALAYALAGRWAESRTVAAQDLSPEQLTARMSEWALLAQPKDAWDQVAALLHVTPVEDEGQPAALALAAAPPPDLAVAAAEPQAGNDASARVEIAQAAEPLATEAQPAEAAPAVEAPALAQADLPASEPYYVERAAVTPPPLIAAPKRPNKVAVASGPVQAGSGRYAVQLGAFSSAASVQSAWNRAVKRVGVSDYVPSHATFGTERIGTVYRLSLAGFQSRADAVKVCVRVRTKGGDCFVRAVAGDRVAEWYSGKVRLASR